MFRHDLEHTGYSPSAAPTTNNVLWSYGTGDAVYSSPAVAYGKVFIGSSGRVYCLDASQGTLLWSYETGDAIRSSPAVADGKVFAGSWDGKVYCFGSQGDADTALMVYPHPFSHSRHTSLTFHGDSIPGGTIRIYDLAGELIRALEEEYGDDKLSWDGRNEKGETVAPGIYICEPGGKKIAIVN